MSAGRAFERLPGETDKAFAALRVYLELGSERSLDAVSKTLHKSVTFLARWSTRWNWVARAGVYDNYMANLEQAKRERALTSEAQKWAERQIEHREKAWRVSQALIEKAEMMLKFPLTRQRTADGKTIVEPLKWSLTDAARLLETADKTARLSAELPTEIVEGMPTLLKLIEILRAQGVSANDLFAALLAEASNAQR